MGSSKVLGILAICLSWLIPLLGVILAIIGLSIHKEKGKENRDFTLNIIGIVVSVIMWIVYIPL